MSNVIHALRTTSLGRHASRLSPAAFAWAFAGYMACWFVGAFAVYMWGMWPG